MNNLLMIDQVTKVTLHCELSLCDLAEVGLCDYFLS